LEVKRIRLTSKQIQLYDSLKTHSVIFFGGAKGGGKSHGLRTILYLMALENPGISIAIFRRTYPELRSNHIDKILIEHPELRPYYNKSEHIIRLPNMSIIEFCYCQRYEDVYLYQGREYEIIAIDEAGQWEFSTFHTLRGSNRTSKQGIIPVTILTGNPGGIGHKWLKRLFIDKQFKAKEIPEDYKFIKSTVYDNPFLMENDPGYISRLEAEPNDMLRRAYLYGDWDVFAGQFFNEFNRDVHVLKADFPMEKHWIRFGAYDSGYTHPAVFGWFACDEEGKVFLYRELVVRGKRPEEIHTMIYDYPDSKNLEYIDGGHDLWSIQRDGGPTISDQFSKLGCYMKKANIDRIQGAAHVRSFLAYKNMPNGTVGPRLFILENCTHTIDTITRMIHDDKRPEDVKKVNATDADPFGGDDCYDMLRYGLMSRPRTTIPVADGKILSYDERVHIWHEKHKRKLSRQINKNYDNILGKDW